MADGLELKGFNDTKAGATNNLDLNPTGQAPASAFPAKDVSNQSTAQGPKQSMCIECGCGMDSLGRGMGDVKVPGGILNVSTDGEAGLTLNMTATQEQRTRFINER